MSTAATQPHPPIATKNVTGRRVLRFSTLDDILADAERLAAGRVRALGNWSLGEALAHLARTMKMSLDGASFRVPFFMRWIARLFKNRLLRSPMRPGFNLPRAAEAQLLASPPVSTEEGLNQLRAAIERLKREPQRAPNPAFGPLTREEWDQLHLRHAELHLSFFMLE